MYPSTLSSQSIITERGRDISGASQFPMRTVNTSESNDPLVYKAKEIPQTPMISEPIEFIPNNLPYPSLATRPAPEDKSESPSRTSSPSGSHYQQTKHAGSPGVKPKGGIFSAFRRSNKSVRRSMEQPAPPPVPLASRPRSSIEQTPPMRRLSVTASPTTKPAGPREMSRSGTSQTLYASSNNRNSLDSFGQVSDMDPSNGHIISIR